MKPVKPPIPTQEEWEKFEGAMDEILKAPPQHKKMSKKNGRKIIQRSKKPYRP